jgi:hypothetical protein
MAANERKPASAKARRIPRTMPAAEPAAPEPAPLVAVTLPDGLWRWLAWAFSLVPVVGLTLGLLFASSPDKKAKRFGRVCLVLALIGLIALAVNGWLKQDGLDAANLQDEVQVLN